MKTTKQSKQSLIENDREQQNAICCKLNNAVNLSRSVWSHFAETFRNLYSDMQLIKMNSKSCC